MERFADGMGYSDKEAVKQMTDREKVIKGLTKCVTAGLEKACPTDCPYFLQCFPDVGPADPFMQLMQDALALLKEQEAEIRQLRLAFDIAKGTCKGIVAEVGEVE